MESAWINLFAMMNSVIFFDKVLLFIIFFDLLWGYVCMKNKL